MVYTCALIILLFTNHVATAAVMGERTSLLEPSALNSKSHSGSHATRDTRMPLDRVSIAVEGAESSHGQDLHMWRYYPAGPQGPMQVSEAAATDVGGGDRFDLTQNRVIGRAYLAHLYRRYKGWPDAIAAYNWGLSNVDSWIKPDDRPKSCWLTWRRTQCVSYTIVVFVTKLRRNGLADIRYLLAI